ncbi:hypothetical protein JD844_022485 [Phrynosoma platyrhinos]|uniref:Poly [ADP-ribose] polymerase n=1 Tax=Phrynosoma platyrhinos TaxID=52577 RepID=A0ABQ7SVP6_PHRPL|nr:hypothetical protein JD844_022485 [Phrynosoma platyrhinos]
MEQGKKKEKEEEKKKKGPPSPVLVQGDWGGPGLPRALRNKLLCYFQSPKRSGGGECQLLQTQEGGPQQLWVAFACEEVLSQKTHELELGEKGTLTLVVTLPETTDETKDPVAKTKPNQTGKVTEEKIIEEKDVQDNISKPTGGNQDHGEDDFTSSQTSSFVAIENVQEFITPDILTLLVENISGLLVQNDFQIELIRERNAAVVTFQRSIDAAKLMDRCTKNSRFKEYKLTARLLELTQMIKVENIPTGIRQAFITLYFESPKHGGGPVSSVKMLPEEESALITFCDNQAVQTVLKKQHSFDHQPVSVYPYYSSLDAVLYGKERLQIKMPDPVRIPLDPYIWQFLQGKDKLTQEIDKEMKNCFCDLMWPPVTCEHPEITISPSSALSKQGRSIRELVKTWKDKVSTEFTCILSKFKTTTCKIIPAEWEKIESSFINNVLAVPDVSKETVTISGFVFNVDSVVNHINAYIENLTRSAEKARQAIQQTLQIAPRQHAVLHRILQDENFYKENSGLKFSYDLSTKVMQLCGMPAEVYKMKSDLLEKLRDMEEKQISVPAQIFQFLQHVDSQKLSAIMFHANNINAAYDLGPNSVLLVGHSSRDLLKAEEQIKKDLCSKLITLEDPELIYKREWKELVKKLLKKHSSVDESVIIDDCFDLEEDTKVTIAGHTTAVTSVYQELSNFVEKNTRMLKVIPVRSVVVVQFMEKEKGKTWQDLKRKGLKINFGLQAEPKNIVLSGPKADVMKAAAIVEKMLSSVYSKKVVFDKPGVKNFFKKREASYIAEAKESFHCLIRLQKDENDDKDSRIKDGHSHAKIKLKDGVVVEVCKGDLTCFPVDVVVNASNEDLKHIGGLADALLKAAGPQLQRDCDDLVRRRGRLRPGCAITTGACNLPCKQVIHAVGPRWSSFEKEKCIHLLKKAVKESLKQAEIHTHHSIAIPAVSSGIFGFPLKECAHSIVTAIKEHLEESSENNSLKQIYLVDVSEYTIQALADALNEIFREAPPQPRSESHSQPASPPIEHGEDFHTVISDGGLKLILQEKGIENAMTDTVVSSIGSDLKLGVGPLSKALLEKAGPELQVEFDLAVQGQGAQGGCVIQTRGYNLASGVVLHAIVPQWDGGKGHAIKKLKAIVRECLERTEELSLHSISFPAIGTGGFSFPKAEVAKSMFEETIQYSRTKKLKSLQEVHFLLHPKDTDNIQAFSQVFESGTGTIPSGMLQTDGRNEGKCFFGPISTPVLGINEMQIGPIKFQTVTGDITKETTDVIVNVTNSSFNAKAGVSKAILEGGGPEVEKECAAFALQRHSGFITTQGGNLVCKKIIHLAPNPDIKTQVSKVLQECEAKKYTSVAFPAIGTGQSGRSPEDAADDMIGAVADFIGKELPQHLKMIKIVIFQPNMQNAFYASMKTREGAALPTSVTSESVFAKFKKFVIGSKPPVPKKRLLLLEKKIEVAVFEICGEDSKNVDAAESWLKKMILQEQLEIRIVDELIDMFDDAEIQKLNELQKRLHIAIQLEREQSPPFILVSGIPRDVLTAFTEIQDLIKKMKDEREERSKAELAKNLVDWQYSKDGYNYKSVDMLANLHLEDAKISNKMHINIQIHGTAYRVDFKNMCAYHKEKTILIKRIAKEEGKVIALPKHWEDMKGNRMKLVVLKPTAEEYKDVERKFQQGCPNYRIEKIERSSDIAAAIGKGTYFAINARYSSQDTYSTPDSNGRKYMYLARVLTGDYCVGSPGMIVPPPRNNGGFNQFDMYDSVTDDVFNPSMFVIFSDAQAYPEYLITFRK